MSEEKVKSERNKPEAVRAWTKYFRVIRLGKLHNKSSRDLDGRYHTPLLLSKLLFWRQLLSLSRKKYCENEFLNSNLLVHVLMRCSSAYSWIFFFFCSFMDEGLKVWRRVLSASLYFWWKRTKNSFQLKFRSFRFGSSSISGLTRWRMSWKVGFNLFLTYLIFD